MAHTMKKSTFVFGTALLLASFGTLGAACKKKEEPKPAVVPEPAPTPAPTPAPEPELKPVVEEAEDAGADVVIKKLSANAVNVSRLKQCCAQLSAEAKKLGAAPEAAVLMGAAAQCNATAGSLGANASAPELGIIKNLLGGRTIPPVCAGF